MDQAFLSADVGKVCVGGPPAGGRGWSLKIEERDGFESFFELLSPLRRAGHLFGGRPCFLPARVKAGLTAKNQAFLYGEFDSGSERTLAAWLRHASRAGYFR